MCLTTEFAYQIIDLVSHSVVGSDLKCAIVFILLIIIMLTMQSSWRVIVGSWAFGAHIPVECILNCGDLVEITWYCVRLKSQKNISVLKYVNWREMLMKRFADEMVFAQVWKLFCSDVCNCEMANLSTMQNSMRIAVFHVTANFVFLSHFINYVFRWVGVNKWNILLFKPCTVGLELVPTQPQFW